MTFYEEKLATIESSGNLRRLPRVEHQGKWITDGGRRMLNLSSNDYLGLAASEERQEEFLASIQGKYLPLSSSSSRLLTGNFPVYTELEERIASSFGREAALLFNSGYHANTGILPALADKRTLILADKLVHASIIDGILLSGAPFLRYRHNDYGQLERLLRKHEKAYDRVFIVTESLFSMDGDVADLRKLVELKKTASNICLYVDEAHAIGARGENGLGIAEEQACAGEIDLLVGTFGKALASMGAYVVCSRVIREYLVNTARPLIFSTALPPFQIAWTLFVWEKLPSLAEKREKLRRNSRLLADSLRGKGGEISQSHIVPFIVGESEDCARKAEELRRKGFYCLPVRPPTVPKGTSRIRISLTADIEEEEIRRFIQNIE